MDDQQAIEQIVLDYARHITKTEDEANQFVMRLSQIVQDDSAKLIHFGNTLFLVLVRGPGVVEVHTMSVKDTGTALAKNLVLLAQYLEKIGVTVAYTYSDDPKMKAIALRSKLPFQEFETQLPEGGKTTVYYLEF